MWSHFIFSFLIFISFVFAPNEADDAAKAHIEKMHQGIVLVRLHTDEVAQAQMKKYRQFKKLRAKQKEVREGNKETILAFDQHFTFCPVYFFYAKDTEKVLAGNYEGLFVDSSLQYNAQISIPENKSIYLVDVGDIYFEAFGGHFEGYAVLDRDLKSLESPFPFYVRRRSGVAIIQRSDAEMVVKLNKALHSFYSAHFPKNYD